MQADARLARPQLGTRARLAANVCVAATGNGLIFLSPSGCFRVGGLLAEFFVSEALPALYFAGNSSPFGSLSQTNAAFVQKLSEVGIVDYSPWTSPSEHPIPVASATPNVGVVLLRRTPVADRVAELLIEQGIRVLDEPGENTLIFADFVGLDSARASQLAYELQKRDCPSLSFWRFGSETFYGPFSQPGRTACWGCFRQRFSDSLVNADCTADYDDRSAAKVVVDNLLLAVRYPECVLVESREVFSAHSVLPVPWCHVCYFVDGSNVPAIGVAHSIHVPEDLRPLADPRGGIVRHLFLFESDGSEAPTVPACCSVRIAPIPNGNGRTPEIRGEGKGATSEDAVRSAIGEGLERYAASLWNPSELILASFNEIHANAFDPRWLVLYDNEQFARPNFPFAPFHPDQPMYWKAGKWLDTSEAVYLPAISTYMNFPVAPADCFTQTTSNGLAAGSTVEDATLRALYELIERDAFMLFWLAGLPALPIAIDDFDQLAHRALVEVERIGARIELYSIDVGTGHPTVVCIGFGDGKSWPGVTVGLGTHGDIDVALRKAVFEHNHYGSYIRQLMLSGAPTKIRCKEDVYLALDHGLYYIDPARADALHSFRAHVGQPTPLAELRRRYRQPAKVSTCVSCLADAGVRAAAVDITSPDIRLASLGVVRAFGTWMQPIHFGAANWRLNNPRLQRLLKNGANTTPHPIA